MKFVCNVCGYVYEGNEAPAECPVCHAKSNMFKKVEGELTLAAEHVFGVYAETVAKIMESIQPDLVAAIQSQSEAKTFNGIAQGIAPYALANGESAAEFVDRLLRGTTLEGVINKFTPKNDNN